MIVMIIVIIMIKVRPATDDRIIYLSVLRCRQMLAISCILLLKSNRINLGSQTRIS